MYAERVRAMTSSERGGGASPDLRSQPESNWSQSRTICLSYDGCCLPGCHWSAYQKRLESGVSTSSASTIVPSRRAPNSNFVSARMIPRCSARACASR